MAEPVHQRLAHRIVVPAGVTVLALLAVSAVAYRSFREVSD